MRDREIAKAEFRSLGLGTRTINTLVAHGIFDLRDLRTITERELLLIPGIDEKARAVIGGYIRNDQPVVESHAQAKTISVTFEPLDLVSIDKWAIQHGIKGRAEAIRWLVAEALTAAGLPTTRLKRKTR